MPFIEGISDIWLIQGSVAAAIIVIVTVIYVMRNRGGYFAVLLKKVGESYAKITTVRFEAQDRSIRFGKKTFTPDMKNISFRDDTARFLGAKFVFYFDYSDGKQLSFLEYKAKIDPDDLDLMVSRNVVAQLVSRLSMMGGTQWLMLIVMLVLGILGGFIIGQFIHIGGSAPAVIPPSNQTSVTP